MKTGELRSGGHYTPILKGKAAEFAAMRQMSSAHKARIVPLVEIIPGDDDENAAEIERALVDGAKKLADSWDSENLVFADTYLVSDTTPLTGGRLAIQFIADELAKRDVQAVPVVRLGDAHSVISAASSVAREHGRGVCVRVLPGDADEPDAAMTDMLSALGMGAENVHVIVDFRAVGEDSLEGLAFGAPFLLNALPNRDEWASVSVAAGAFPPDLSGFPSGSMKPTGRHDADLWRRVRSKTRIQLGYADYAISHPLLAIGIAFAPAPQLRYTIDNEWLVFRGQKRNPRGSHQFYDHCASLLRLGTPPYSGEGLSWGDDYINKAAQSTENGTQPLVGPGNATTWRSIATSHHMAFVVNRLTIYGEP